MNNKQLKARGSWKRKSIGDRVFDFTNYALLAALTLVCFYPILHILFASVSDPVSLIAHKGALFKPLGFTLDGYKLVFKDNSLLNGYKNTIIYVGLGTLVNMVMTILGAYVLSRRDLYFKNYIMVFITITMFLAGVLFLGSC